MDLRMCSHGVPHEFGPCEYCLEITDLRVRLAAAEQELAEAKAGWEAADAQISIEAGDVMRITKERDELKAYVIGWEDVNAALTKERDELRAEVGRLKGCSEGYRKSADTYSELMTSMQKRAEQAEAELKIMQAASSISLKKHKELESALKTAQEENERLRDAVIAEVEDEGNPEVCTCECCMRKRERLCRVLETNYGHQSQLTTAQQSAKEQFVAGMEKAAEIVDNVTVCGCVRGPIGEMYLKHAADVIREAAKEASK